MRAANNDPLYAMPEADEPMILTATGPIFLKGTLDSQLEPPPPPPTVVQPPPDAPKPEDDAPKPEDDLAKFATYATTRLAKGRTPRPFVFSALPQHIGEALNKALMTNDIHVVLAEIDKVKNKDPGKALKDSIVTAYTNTLHDALTKGVNANKLAQLINSIHKVADPLAEALVRDYFANLSTEGLISIMKALATDSYVAGANIATTMLGGHTITSTFNTAISTVNWGAWVPGWGEAAAKLALDNPMSSLRTTLGMLDSELQGIRSTQIKRISMSVSNSISNGDTVGDTAKAISDIVSNTQQAQTIANTLMNDAMTQASLDQFKQSDITEWKLLVWNPCDVCEAVQEENPHAMDDTPPPYHPNCRCSVSPVVS